METTNIGNAANVFLCSNCLAYQVAAKGEKCKRCSPVPQTSSGQSDANLGIKATFLTLGALAVGTAVVFVVRWLGS